MMCVYIVCNARETNMLAVNEALRETSGEWVRTVTLSHKKHFVYDSA